MKMNYKYYTEDGQRFLQLHDHHTLWRIEPPDIYNNIDEIYWNYVNKMIEKFENHFENIIIYLQGRSTRHVCVEDNTINRRRYKYLCNYALKLEEELITKINNLNNNQKEI